jgi:hypothetical protein
MAALSTPGGIMGSSDQPKPYRCKDCGVKIDQSDQSARTIDVPKRRS